MNDLQPKKPIFLYVVITVLTLALISLGVLTFFSLDRLASLQNKVGELQRTVQEISDSAASLSEKADELEKLQIQEQQAAAAAQESTAQEQQEAQEPQEAQNEGTLSPSSGGTFTENTDESMDNLLSQINGLLPQDNGTWSVYVCNLLKNSEGSINDHPMQAASLIKLFIMGTVYENYQDLAGQYGVDSLDANLNSMITVSDNDAANTLVNWLGGGDNGAGMAKVNAFCQAHGYTSTSMGRMLLQSTENGDNYTSVKDCGKFLKEVYQINNGTAENASLSNAEAMYYLLKLQTRTNKIPAAMPEGVRVANKTGELDTVENDAGIVYSTANGIDLVICFMSENLADTGAAQSSIAQNSRLIYGYYNE
ncbi:class A beta-lactamase-related serine hydrolase [Blautia schinkii]|nr:class A beta-lactamase-related serine hydrolase [Blautia schinkii]